MTENKSVLMICPNGEFGGAERTAINFASALNSRQNWRCKVVLLRQGPMEKELTQRGLPFHVLSKFRYSRPLTWFRVIRELRQIINNENISLVHSEMAYAQIIGATLSLLTRKPACWYQHGPASKASLLQWLAAILPSTGFITNSSYSYGIQPHLLFTKHRGIIPPPLSEDFFSTPRNRSLRNKIGISNDEILILIPARFQRIKGQIFALNSFALIQQRFPQAHLAFLGSPPQANAAHRDQRDYQRVLNRAKTLNESGKRKRIHIFEFDTNIIPYLDAADIVLSSTLIPETFGCIIAEAMSRGTAVIAANAGGMRDIVHHGENGHLYTLADQISLQAGLAKLIEDSNYRKHLVENGLRRSHDFRLDTISPKLENFFNEIFKKNI